MPPIFKLFSSLCLLSLLLPSAADGGAHLFKYKPAPAGNPLKGLVPYAGKGVEKDGSEQFPHSMEFSYLPLGKLMTGPGRFDWDLVETLLNEIAGRGHQAVLRVYLEYPGKPDGIPDFLLKSGMKRHEWLNENTQPFPSKMVTTPDYEDKNLRAALRQFIAAFGERYDGDPRLGFLTAGLLGTWGEWHTAPRPDLWASHETQVIVMDAYAQAFKITPVLLRYPAGAGDSEYAENASRPFGYHDDSFAWATLPGAGKGTDWHFMSKMKRAGAFEKWRGYPIGGEVRPESWGVCFDDPPGTPDGQAFSDCVQATHVTWLMDSGVFRKDLTPERKARALQQVARMGYEFHVTASEFPDTTAGDALPVRVEVTNRGVAPLYHDWPVVLALVDEKGVISHETKMHWQMRRLMPGDGAQSWTGVLPLGDTAQGEWRLVMKGKNPLENGAPIRFANETQDKDVDGWLSLGIVQVTTTK